MFGDGGMGVSGFGTQGFPLYLAGTEPDRGRRKAGVERLTGKGVWLKVLSSSPHYCLFFFSFMFSPCPP